MSPELQNLLFTSYGPVHWSMLALTAVGSVVMQWLGRRHRGTPRATTFSRAFGIVMAVVTVGFFLLWLWPSLFNLDQSLPLHFSDVLRFMAALALLTHRRLPVAVTYYWGLTLNIQSLLTPDLTPMVLPAAEFVSYWLQHIMIMWAVCYLTWGLKLAPDWRSYRLTLLFTLGFAAVVFTINSVLGTNYAYLNRKPASTSALDLLGGWPLYLLVVLVLMIVVWGLMTWPWTRRSRTAAEPETVPESVRS
ncbi:YwaF family protein [Microlunatus sp. Y2014]|uniref:YwaF family protein n=1 Tax=Microlunatus sp. Y2014 TaxID=3418488 RepID=UPI003DA71087